MADLAGQDPSRSWVARIIGWSVRNRLIVLALSFALAVAGTLAVLRTPLDAIPDLTDTQVIVRTDFPGQSPQVVEDLVTYPLSSALLGLPRTEDVRAASMFGTSFVTIVFEDGTDLYWARDRVANALARVRTDLPDAADVQMGPDATGVGWVYQYALLDRTGERSLADLRTIQDYYLKLELVALDGVAEVASVGGYEREYQVLIDPLRLRAFDVPITRVAEAVRSASGEVGGRTIEQAETEYVVRASGYVNEVADLEQVVVSARDGTPVTLSDLGRIVEGPALRRGAVDLNGQGDVVAGIVVMRDGENALAVTRDVRARLAELAPGLPAGVEVVSVYDRGPLIEGAVSYLEHKLIEEGIAVALVTLIFLLHARAALVAVITLPLGVLAAFLVMNAQGVTANIMSLGGIAIAIGAMVDASIVMVENAARKLSEAQSGSEEGRVGERERQRIVVDAAREVGPGIFFSLLVIVVSFLPVFALTGESFRLFSPLAYTKTYAMAFAAALSVTLVPVLMVLFLRDRIRREDENPVNRLFVRAYRPALALALRKRWATLVVTGLLMLSALWPATRIGSEFMPPLYEGELLYMPTTLPSVSQTKIRQILQQTNRAMLTVPEVENVFGKAGRADTATDPAPLTMIETWIELRPKSEWRDGVDVEDIIGELNRATQMPGLVNSFGYPIKIRMDMVSTGVRTPVGIKVTGDDLSVIAEVAQAVERVVADVPGTRSAFADRVLGGRYIEVEPDRSELARRGIDMGTFQMVVQTALGGTVLTEAVEGRERYGVTLRYDRPYRETPEDIARVLVPGPEGAHYPLGEVASVSYADGPPMIRSENARLTGWVFVDIADRDLGGYVEEARAVVAEAVDLPPGYALQWSGQYEQLQEARARLSIAVPAAALLVFLLLLLHFGRLDRTLIVLLSLPFGLIGGLWAVYLAGYEMSVAVAVGFIALGGIAVETAVVMLLYIDQQLREAKPSDEAGLTRAVTAGAVARVRPKLMTVTTIIVGLAPIFVTDGLGADVMRRIALPMLGGMVTTTLLTLIVIPVIVGLWVGRSLSARAGRDRDLPRDPALPIGETI
ncbi:efflux RND transporter permease subunit [Parvularcula dongshanensis]|uniref:Cu(I)/Ag(I) efflux system membrane protein CusA/SilA n=1 Tax=Parvularcula dongshanensis TaxID=1173995 RepID=A0A840I7U5_9PROT|nr:CusA/CzcA family heavy metal efflux RND transporter [Parvularcula dongshanensis]MBB4660244.1 Cu(I)/Ag(I) efflux system membrane protein CusA/SilA [Parvularcula dongshanensis]